ncbi:MAG TPA: hypothetical protein VFX86_00725 [Candidatus Saccharimonadales bacterium]|nr:hypothetical protein [Candidatus Saccharimonadales bacterium]
MTDLLINPATEETTGRIVASQPHAIGLQGEKESGRKYLALYIARRFLGVENLENYPHVLTIDCEKSGIEEVREAIRFLRLKIPGKPRIKRCLLFWSFEKFGVEAQNAMLKSLEEPPADTVIIITTDAKSSLLPTTVSRLSWIAVLPISLKQANEFFHNKYREEVVQKAYLLSGGKPAMTIKLLKNYDEHPMVDTISSIKTMLKADRFERLAEIDRLVKDKEFDMDLYLESLCKVLETVMKNQIDKYNHFDKRLLEQLKRINTARSSQRYNVNQKLLLTNVFYNL